MIDLFFGSNQAQTKNIKHGYYYLFEPNSQPRPAKFLATVVYRQRYMQG
jgi:hypothetical protein